MKTTEQLFDEAVYLFGKGSTLSQVVQNPGLVTNKTLPDIIKRVDAAVLKKEAELEEFKRKAKWWLGEVKLSKKRAKVPQVAVEYYRNLSPHQQTLITLRDELYEGSWNAMKADLQQRVEGKPFIFKLVKRIEQDLKDIKKLQEYENNYDVNLQDCVE